MQQQELDRIQIEDNDDVVRVRARVREAAARAGFGHVDQVRLVTAASELARNIRLYAERGLGRNPSGQKRQPARASHKV